MILILNIYLINLRIPDSQETTFLVMPTYLISCSEEGRGREEKDKIIIVKTEPENLE